jgi:hypothetical protein
MNAEDYLFPTPFIERYSHHLDMHELSFDSAKPVLSKRDGKQQNEKSPICDGEREE